MACNKNSEQQRLQRLQRQTSGITAYKTVVRYTEMAKICTKFVAQLTLSSTHVTKPRQIRFKSKVNSVNGTKFGKFDRNYYYSFSGFPLISTNVLLF